MPSHENRVQLALALCGGAAAAGQPVHADAGGTNARDACRACARPVHGLPRSRSSSACPASCCCRAGCSDPTDSSWTRPSARPSILRLAGARVTRRSSFWRLFRRSSRSCARKQRELERLSARASRARRVGRTVQRAHRGEPPLGPRRLRRRGARDRRQRTRARAARHGEREAEGRRPHDYCATPLSSSSWSSACLKTGELYRREEVTAKRTRGARAGSA